MAIIRDNFAKEYFLRYRKGCLPVDVVEKIVLFAGRRTTQCSGVNCHNFIVAQKQKFGDRFVFAYYVVEHLPICFDCSEGEQYDIVTLNLH